MIKVTAVNFKLTKGIEDYVGKRMGKFNKFLKEDNKLNVKLENNRYGNKVEASFKLNNKPLRASVLNDDLYIAVDLLSDKVSSVIDKNAGKDSLVDRDNSIRFMRPVSSLETGKEDEEGLPRIVKRKTISSKPMFEEEAIEQMELLDHRSFIFFNASTEKISMMYKRHDGNYGILEVN